MGHGLLNEMLFSMRPHVVLDFVPQPYKKSDKDGNFENDVFDLGEAMTENRQGVRYFGHEALLFSFLPLWKEEPENPSPYGRNTLNTYLFQSRTRPPTVFVIV